MPSPPKERNNHLLQTNAQDTLSEKLTNDDFCAVTINETSPSMTRYVGLENQGATCYLNTVLQMLFMTEEFRESVEGYVMNSSSCTINNHIAQLFKCLKSRERNTATTEGITAELKINVQKQDDAAKCLQKILNKVDPEISKVFQGEMAQTTICINPAKKHDPLKQVKTFFILSISLNSEPPVHMQKCFNSYFAPINMYGDNQQVYCKACGRMVKTKIISSLQKVPSVLVLHLERFEFDYDAMCCVKNYSSVQIPLQLLVEEEAGVNHTYDLYAIANHSGSLIGGHYYADVKDENGWHQFNDSMVNTLKMYLTCDSDIHSDEAYLLLYKKCESASPQNNSTQICNDPEDVSISAGSKPKRDTLSVVSETESQVKRRKIAHSEGEKEKDQQDLQLLQTNSSSDSETEADASQTMPDEPVPDRESIDADPSRSLAYFHSLSAPPEAPPTSTHHHPLQKPHLRPLNITNLHPLQKPRLLPLTITNLHPLQKPHLLPFTITNLHSLQKPLLRPLNITNLHPLQKPRLRPLNITNLHPLHKPRLLPFTITNLHPLQKPRLLPLTITNLHPLQKPRLLPLTITNLHPLQKPRLLPLTIIPSISPAYFHSPSSPPEAPPTSTHYYESTSPPEV